MTLRRDTIIRVEPQECDEHATGPGLDCFAAEVTELTNRVRIRQGLRPLVPSEPLHRAALSHARDMARMGRCQHEGAEGSQVWDRVRLVGYNGWSCIAENVAAGQASPEEVVQAWTGSAEHRRNILNPQFTELGVGYAEGADGLEYQGSPLRHFWVQVFGSRPMHCQSPLVIRLLH